MSKEQMIVSLEITALQLRIKGCAKAAALVEEAKDAFLAEIREL